MKSTKINLLRHHQREAFEEDYKVLKEQAVSPHTQMRGKILTRMKKLERQLQAQSPEPLTPTEKDLLFRREKELEGYIKEGMPTDVEMRRNPPGAVHKHTQWEKVKKNAVLEWKNVRIQLNPDSSDPDLSNVEILRPKAPVGITYLEAQIPTKFALSPQAKENYDAIDWKDRSPDQIVAEPSIEPAPLVSTTSSSSEIGLNSETMLCACGCGRSFVPKNDKHLYYDGECRRMFNYLKVKAKRQEAAKVERG